MLDILKRDIVNHLYILNGKRQRIHCITTLVSNLVINKKLNGTNEIKFDIVYDNKYKEIYNKLTFDAILLLDNFGEFVIDSESEDNQGHILIKSLGCKSSEWKMNSRCLTLATSNVDKYFQGYLYSTDVGENSIMSEIFKEIPSWSIGTVDPTINRKLTFKDIKKNNIHNFIYNNIEQTYDCIPFFNSINHTISFKSTENSKVDSGIVLSFDNFVTKFGKECVNDTVCTKMYVEGGNLDIRRVNCYGDNFVYNYDKVYHLMSDTLRNELQNWFALVATYENDYATKFTDWSELSIELKTNNDIVDNTDAQMKEYNDTYFVMKNQGASQAELDAYFAIWYEWQFTSGRWDALDKVDELEPLVDAKYQELQSIVNICKRSANLTQSSLIELDMFEREQSYKQDAFAYISWMNEEQKSEISQMLKEQATKELARMNEPRFNFTIDLVNFCNITGCEYFANELDVGKYITIIDTNGNTYKPIIIAIEYDTNNESAIKLTFSDKLSGHESFAQLNKYINDAIKTKQDFDTLDNRVDGIQDNIDDLYSRTNAIGDRISNVVNSLREGSGGSTPTPIALIHTTNTSIAFTDTNNVVTTYTLTKNADGKITNILGNGQNITVTRS